MINSLPWDEIETVMSCFHQCYVKYQHLTYIIANELRQIDFLQPITDGQLSLTGTIADVIATVTSYSAEVTRVYLVALEKVHDVMSEAYERFMETEESVYIREAVRELAEQVRDEAMVMMSNE